MNTFDPPAFARAPAFVAASVINGLRPGKLDIAETEDWYQSQTVSHLGKLYRLPSVMWLGRGSALAGFSSLVMIDSLLPRRVHMNTVTTSLHFYLRGLVEREEGQDLVEYALVVALIAFGAITSMNFLASGLNTAFSDVAVTLTSNIT